MKKFLFTFLTIMILFTTVALANCNGCGEGDHSNTCNEGHDHEHKPAEKILVEEHKDSSSEPENGVVFAVCIFAIAEDGSRVLVDHRASENLMDCLKNKREAERDYRDPEKISPINLLHCPQFLLMKLICSLC